MRLFIFLAALLCTTPVFADEPEGFSWMRGCWRTETPRDAESSTTFTEVWIAPPGPVMFGYAYHEGEGAFQGWEQMRIERDDGGTYFVAMPNGGAPVRFRWDDILIRMSDNPTWNGWSAAFENAEHDYPQRISYRRTGNELTATISRIDGTDRISFVYRRIRCPANLRP
ncbi:MAG: DUF6265 family protein [Alphaproteobacteria bacterium]|nr:DUF6265 family protein [Alphaproteobacteria bacterium]